MAETVSMSENHPGREGGFCVGILDFAQIVTLGEFAQNSRARGCTGRNNEVGMPEQDFYKSGAVVKT